MCDSTGKIHVSISVIGCHLPPEKPSTSHFDSNCITPVSGNHCVMYSGIC